MLYAAEPFAVGAASAWFGIYHPWHMKALTSMVKITTRLILDIQPPVCMVFIAFFLILTSTIEGVGFLVFIFTILMYSSPPYGSVVWQEPQDTAVDHVTGWLRWHAVVQVPAT